MVDDGAHGEFIEYSEVSASTFVIEVSGLTLSLDYRFKVIATNHIGSRESNIVSAICADLPSTPETAPTFV
jgi:hypothetical protein